MDSPTRTPSEVRGLESPPPMYGEHEGTLLSGNSSQQEEKEDSQKRLSTYSFADLPEVVPAHIFDGVQVVPDISHKEVVSGTDPQVAPSKQFPEVHHQGTDFPEVYSQEHTVEKPALDEVSSKRRRICGLRLKWAFLILASLLVLIIALGTGLGVGLHGSSNGYEAPANVFDGTKISIGGLSRELGDPSDLAMYMQHADGGIRWMEQTSDNTWAGANSSTIVALDCKPRGPVSVVSYNWDGLDNWRVFYIDNTNTLRETWQATQTWSRGWELGLLNNLAVKAWDNPRAGMVACWYGTTSGANFSEGSATSTDAANVLIRLVYATDATTFQEMSFRADTQVWSFEQTIENIDATSIPACSNGQPGTVDYLMVVNQHNNINVFWKDLGNTTNTTRHPTGIWKNSSISIPNAGSGATLAFADHLFAQDTTTNMIKGYNISFAAENSSVDIASAFEVQGDAGTPQTGIAVTIEHDEYVVLYQTNSTSISNFNRAVDGGDWSMQGIHVPKD